LVTRYKSRPPAAPGGYPSRPAFSVLIDSRTYEY
jgi:hypothetical protein